MRLGYAPCLWSWEERAGAPERVDRETVALRRVSERVSTLSRGAWTSSEAGVCSAEARTLAGLRKATARAVREVMTAMAASETPGVRASVDMCELRLELELTRLGGWHSTRWETRLAQPRGAPPCVIRPDDRRLPAPRRSLLLGNPGADGAGVSDDRPIGQL
jgi:hypothetical protein